MINLGVNSIKPISGMHLGYTYALHDADNHHLRCDDIINKFYRCTCRPMSTSFQSFHHPTHFYLSNHLRVDSTLIIYILIHLIHIQCIHSLSISPLSLSYILTLSSLIPLERIPSSLRSTIANHRMPLSRRDPTMKLPNDHSL